jgi:hypothetical protein
LSGRRAIQQYISLTVPKKTIDVNTSPAQAKLNALILKINNLSHARPTVNTDPGHGGSDGDPNTPFASGGYTGRGGKYEPAGIVHRGEFVMSSEATSGNEMLLDAIHRGLRGYADGGRVGGGTGLAAFIRNDLDMKFPHTLKQWNKALEESTKVVDKEKDRRQALLDQAQAVKDAIGSNYKSDLFGQAGASSVWLSPAERMKAGTGDVFSTLSGDIRNLGSLKSAIAKLKGKGLTGPALADLLSNGSLSDVQALAGDSRSDIAKYESLYNKRDRLLASVGSAGASASFGTQLATEKRQLTELVRLRSEVAHMRKDAEAREKKREKALKHAAPKRRP